MTEDDILGALNNLGEDDFESFKWYLQKVENPKGSIKSCRLEKASRRDTVDLMVQTYGLPGALEVTINVLKNIPRNDLAEHLLVTNSGETGNVKTVM